MPPEEDPLYEEIEEEVTDDEVDPANEDDEDEDEDVEMNDGDGNVNGVKQDNGMDVEGADRDGSDLFDGDEDEPDTRDTRRPVEDDEYD
jgi:hypothetical protein